MAMRILFLIMIAVMALTAVAWGQGGNTEPYIGYLYPAGGQQGTTFLVVAGGQSIRAIKGVVISGSGVRAERVDYLGRFRNVDREQREALEARMKAVGDRRMAEMRGETPEPLEPVQLEPRNSGTGTLPNHPLLYGIDGFSLRELAHVRHELLNFHKRQLNAQIAEAAILRITIAPGAEPGDRELRLVTPNGATNPVRFQVGVLSEIKEMEPNDPKTDVKLPVLEPLELPLLINGQIMPGDIDRFAFKASAGQRITVAVYARHLIPFMADAVPGWFQAVAAVYDAKGQALAYADDYRFNPDPVLLFKIPEDGEYQLEIHDALYRGREDFVYRIAVGELPFVTSIYPLGLREGSQTESVIEGWNLPQTRIALEALPGPDRIRELCLFGGAGLTNRLFYVVDVLPECFARKPEDGEKAQPVQLPVIINGRISRPGERDEFSFEGKAGDTFVAETIARALHSPLDPVLYLNDEAGNVLAWNDDHMERDEEWLHPDMGLLTHHADAYLYATLPDDGVYRVGIADSQGKGSPSHVYRLRIGPPRPDFAARMTPSSINVPPGRSAVFHVYVQRRDGFDGPIEVALDDAPPGYILDGGRIPAGQSAIRMTISVPVRALPEPVALRLTAQAVIDETTVTRPVMPTDDRMQAFLYRHLAPAEQLIVTAPGGRGRALVRLLDHGVVRIPQNGAARVRVKAPGQQRLRDVQLALCDAPAGICIEDVRVHENGLAFSLAAAAGELEKSISGNLIVEAFTVRQPTPGDEKGPKNPQRISHGVLPAIPFETVAE
jgi:hypothetical protein